MGSPERVIRSASSPHGRASPLLSCLIASCLGSCFPVLAEPATAVDAYNKGNRQYGREDYEKAAESYETCLELGVRNASVHYNLGNAYFQAGDLGKAILAYERARRLAPRDADLLSNLHQARLLTRDEIEVPTRSGLGAALELGLSRVAVNDLVQATSGVYLAALTLLLLRLFLSNVVARRVLGAACVVLGLVVCVETAALGLKLHHVRGDRSAVVLASEVDVRSGPSNNFGTAFKLHAGTVVGITETRDLWHRVEASPELSGWLRQDTVESVR